MKEILVVSVRWIKCHPGSAFFHGKSQSEYSAVITYLPSELNVYSANHVTIQNPVKHSFSEVREASSLIVV